jgi:hypothetical protein
MEEGEGGLWGRLRGKEVERVTESNNNDNTLIEDEGIELWEYFRDFAIL